MNTTTTARRQLPTDNLVGPTQGAIPESLMPEAQHDAPANSKSGVPSAATCGAGGQLDGLASPTACRHHLARRLRQLRKAAALTGQLLADASGLTRQVISEGENAQRVLSVRDVYRLLAALPDTGEFRHLAGLACQAAAAGWWACYAAVLDDRQCLHIDLEGGAARVQVYCQVGLPDALYTEGYARHRAELRRQSISPEQVAEAMAVRQRLLWSGGIDYEAVVEESALRRLWAPPPALREQLNHLASQAEAGHLRVLPADAHLDSSEPPTTSFAIYSYIWSGEPDEPISLVAVDSDLGDRVLHDRGQLDRYDQQYAAVAAAALSPEDSAALVRGLPADGPP